VDYERFVKRVREEAGFGDEETARRGIEAVPSTLGERVYRTEASHLAAQLPRELKPALFEREPPELDRASVPPYSLEEFHNRVAARADLGRPAAVRIARAVAVVLKEAIAPGELAHVLAELPAEFAQLFDGSSPGTAPRSSR